jgi:hypothetical protein
MSVNNKKDYKSTIKNIKDTPMWQRMHHPVTDPPLDLDLELYENKAHEFSFVQGITDEGGFPIDNDDYYGLMTSLGFYDPKHLGKYGPFTHDTNTTTVLHYNNTAYQKTPIDLREDSEPNLSKVALDYKEANLYNIQDFSETSARRILEKTHRIQTDPDRKIQAQELIDIQREKGRLMDERLNRHPLAKLLSYNEMLLKINTLTLNRITDVLDYLEKQYTFSKYELRPKGYTFYAEMTLPTGQATTHIDFTDDRKNINVPSNAVMFRFPRHNLLSLQIIFDSGADIYYSTNEPSNSNSAFVKLNSLVLPNQVTIVPGQQVINTLNIRADGGTDGVVRLVGLY